MGLSANPGNEIQRTQMRFILLTSSISIGYVPLPAVFNSTEALLHLKGAARLSDDVPSMMNTVINLVVRNLNKRFGF